MKRVYFAFMIICFAFILGCTNQHTANSETGLADLYIKTIDTLFAEDAGLNDGITFIAVQMDSMKGLTKEDEKIIEEFIQSKGYIMKNASIDELKQQKEFDEEKLYIKNGVLIKIDEIVEFNDSRIKMKASKYRSGTGAIGLTFTFKKTNGIWELLKSDIGWIS